MTHPHLTPYDNVLDTIGWTPLIRLGRVGAGVRTPVYGKAEYANPGGSVKDRIGLAIIEDAELRGDLKPGGTVVEGTSGNTGVGLAVAAAPNLRFAPARHDGKPVAASFLQPIYFRHPGVGGTTP